MTDILKNNPILKKAIQTWGKQAQLLMVLEEMAELQKEILKNINRHKENGAELADETADVLIMLEQLMQIYDMRDAVENRILHKLEKIKKRVEE